MLWREHVIPIITYTRATHTAPLDRIDCSKSLCDCAERIILDRMKTKVLRRGCIIGLCVHNLGTLSIRTTKITDYLGARV